MTDKELIHELLAMAKVSEPGSDSATMREAADRIRQLSHEARKHRTEMRFTTRGNMEDEG